MKKSVFRRKMFIRITSMLMTLLILFAVPPTVVYAEALSAIASIGDGSADGDTVQSGDNSADTYTTVRDVYEVTELREESVKHFRLEDGSYVAMAYDAPVHYVGADGSFLDIDNRLFGSGSEYSTSNARIKFAKKITGNGSLFTLHENNTKITLSLVDAIKKTEGRVTSDHSTDEREETPLGKLANLENLTSSIIYENILEGVDLEYVVRSLNIKENIIVKQKLDTGYAFSFELALNNLTAALTDTGDVRITNASGETAYVIPAPIVFDNGGAYAPRDAAGYTLTGGKSGKYTLTVSVSPEWMNAEDRVYPITVDPTFRVGNLVFEDTYVTPNSEDTYYGNATYFPLDKDGVILWKANTIPSLASSAYITEARLGMYSFTDLPPQVVGAHFVTSEWNDSIYYTNHLDGAGEYESVAMDMANTTEWDYGYTWWDITYAARKWHSGIGNNGIALKVVPNSVYYDYSTGGYYSIESSTKPKFTISYIDMRGIESHFPMSSHSMGFFGDASVNLATGQLTAVIPTLSTTDSLMPYTVSLVYNSDMASKAHVFGNANTAYTTSFMPYGYKLNITETVIKTSYTDINDINCVYYIYMDADGTEHNFLPVGSSTTVYTDEDGLQKVLAVESDGTITITDDSKITKRFSAMSSTPSTVVYGAWYLTEIEDVVGNKIVFTFDSAYRPTKVSLKPVGMSNIDFLNLVYKDGYLHAIYNPSSKDIYLLKYSLGNDYNVTTAGYLYEVQYLVGNSSTTTDNILTYLTTGAATNLTYITQSNYYYTNGRLTSTVDHPHAQMMEYTWSGNKVTGVRMYYEGVSDRAELRYTYTNGYTDIRSNGNDDEIMTSDDIITRYVFDKRGRAVSVYSTSVDGKEIYGATSGSYETQENVKNNLKEQFVMGGSAANILLNGNFEKYDDTDKFAHWSESGNVTKVASTVASGEGFNAVKFAPTANTTASITQYIRLEPGTYTLSMPYATFYSNGITGSISIDSLDAMNFSYSEEISLNPTLSNGSTSFFSTSFTIPENGYRDTLSLTISFSAGSTVSSSAAISIDRVMLERGTGASPYNSVWIGDFEAGSGSYNGSPITPEYYWYYYDGELPIIYDDTGFYDSLMIPASSKTESYAWQNIYTTTTDNLNKVGSTSGWVGLIGCEFSVSGFAKSATAIHSDNGIFRIRVDVSYYMGQGVADEVVSHYFDFEPTCTDWQFVSGTFNTDCVDSSGDSIYDCVRRIDIYCEFYNQQDGYALFDNIAVTFQENPDVTRYVYNVDGLVTRKTSAYYEEYYEYDDNNRNVIRIANNRGEITDYVYTAKGQVDYALDYDFCVTQGGSRRYPYGADDPDLLLTKTGKTKTDYTYNTYGMLTKVETYEIDIHVQGTGTNRTETVSNRDGTKAYNYSSYSYNISSGSKIFGALTSEYDSSSVDIRHYYDSTNGRLLASINVNRGSGTCYTYDSLGRMTSAKPATFSSYVTYTPETNTENVTYTYNSGFDLSTITTDSTTYTFTYNVFHDPLTVKAGNNTLITYEYGGNADGNGKLEKATYSNGLVVEYVYNTLENLSEVWYTNNTEARTKAYSYEYTSKGQLYKVTDHLNGNATVYQYDVSGRILSSRTYSIDDNYHDFSVDYSYDDTTGFLIAYYYDVNYTAGTSLYTETASYYVNYLADGMISSISVSAPYSSGTISYTYDDYGRLTGEAHTERYGSSSTNSFRNDISYTYIDNNTRTTGLVGTYSSSVNGGTATTYTYTYDGSYNITKIVHSDGKEIRYYYDNLSQLVREDNGLLNYTYVYAYDNAGNLTSVKRYLLTAEGATPSGVYTLASYGYSTGEWGDLLTSYANVAITYDSIGNPLSYYNGSSYTFTWTGRQLTGAVKGSDNFAFTYDDNGTRVTKTKNGVLTTYYYDGTKLIAEETSGNVTMYIYDVKGSPIGMQYRTSSYAEGVWDTYYFEKNHQGDVVAVYSYNGTKLISYKYDAWGKTTITYSNSGASTTAVNNSITYRGYYYDKDLGLYYLQARYYDPVVKRFINADGYVSTGQGLLGYNMFAYCENNPVNRVDYSGDSWIAILGLVAIGVFVLTTFTSSEAPSKEEQIKQAIDAADRATLTVNRDNKTVYIAYDTKDFINSVSVSQRGTFYQRLYDRSLEAANKASISTDNIMTVEHIKWEAEIHVWGYGIFEECKETNLNYEETYEKLASRVLGKVVKVIAPISRYVRPIVCYN